MADVQMSPAGHAAPGSGDRAPAAALLDALFDDAHVGLGYWDRDLRFQRVNERLAAINGVPVEAHLGLRLREVVPHVGPQVEQFLARVLASGEPLRDVAIEGETLAAPSVRRHWLAQYFPVRDGTTAEVIGVAGLVVEVTGERQADVRAASALQRTQFIDAELRALYSALPVGVAFLGPDLRYQRVNETLAQLNGRPVAAHIGASVEDVLGEYGPAVRAALVEVMETRIPRDFELTLPAVDESGEERALEATYFPVVDGGDELLGVGGIVRDVTDRHNAALEQSRLLREALFARARAEAAGVRAEDAREEAERTGAEAERARARMALLAHASRRMTASLDWEATLDAVVHSVVPNLADWSSLTVADPGGRLRVVAVAHADPEREKLAWELVERYPPDPDGPSGVGHVIRTGELEAVADISPDVVRVAARDADHLRLLQLVDLRHVVVAPLPSAQGVIGALTFVLGESGRRFSDDDLDLIRALAARAALHIENARLYTERSNIAKTLQASLLPGALPAVEGAELASRYLPAGDQNTVGGDFYDVFRTGERVWTAIIGDVSGKGAAAAALTAHARHTLRVAARLHDDPADNLTLLNAEFTDSTTQQQFCTAIYARICPAEGGGLDVRLANGGHPAPLVLRADGRLEAVDAGRGPLIGFLPDARFAEATLRLEPGDLLLLYTDGVTEVRTTDPALGERELRSTLAAHADAPAAHIVAAVVERALELQDGAARDDIALLAIKATDSTSTTAVRA